MIEYVVHRPTSTSALFAISAAMLAGQLQYPPQIEPYQITQVRGTYSDFTANLAAPRREDYFAQQMVTIYKAFAQRQEPLGADFDAAIFSDLEGLYEA